MTQDDLDALIASGLNPIVIDENFDFNQLSALLGLQPKDTDELGLRTTQADQDSD